MEQQKPLSIGQVLDRGFSVYRQSLGAVIPLSLLAALLPSVPRLFSSPELLLKGGQAAGLGKYFLLVFVMSLIGMSCWIAVIRKLDDVASGRNQLGTVQAFSGGLRYFLPFLGASFLYGMVVMVGFILLVVPGIILAVSLSMSLFPLLLDNSTIVGSLERSRALVRGHWWRTTAILTVVMLIYIALVAGISALLGLMLPFSNAVATAGESGAPNTLLLLVITLATAVLNSLLLPLFYAVTLVTYRDLELRKDGADLAARIDAVA